MKEKTAPDVVKPNVRKDLKKVVRNRKQISSDHLEEEEGGSGLNLDIEARH